MIAFAEQPKPAWGAVVDGERRYVLHAGQSDIMRSDARFVAAVAGTGGGKTALGPLWLMNEIRQHPGRQWLVVGPTYPVLRRQTVPTLLSTLAGTDLEGTYVESRGIYLLPAFSGDKTRDVIYIVSADNPDSMEGGQYMAAWCDEAGQYALRAWIAIQGRLGLHQGRCLITTTPYSLNWLKTEVFDRYRKGDPDYYVRQWDSTANPAYPRAELERARRTMSRHRFRMRYCGEFAQGVGVVYPDLETICKVPATPPPTGRNVGGIDFGYNDPFACLAGTLYIDEDGRDILYVWYERYKRFQTMAIHAQAIPFEVDYGCDRSRPDSIVELRQAGHTARGVNNSIDLGIDAVTARINTGRLKISETCRALFAEAQDYSYPEDPQREGETKGEKPKGLDHALDALRYMVMLVDGRRIAVQTEQLLETVT